MSKKVSVRIVTQRLASALYSWSLVSARSGRTVYSSIGKAGGICHSVERARSDAELLAGRWGYPVDSTAAASEVAS